MRRHAEKRSVQVPASALPCDESAILSMCWDETPPDRRISDKMTEIIRETEKDEPVRLLETKKNSLACGKDEPVQFAVAALSERRI